MYAQCFEDRCGGGYLVSARSKSALINKVKGLVRKGEAGGGALLYDNDRMLFGEIDARDGVPTYKRKW